MWVDQICINQVNVRERDSQVLLMRDIYRHAARTQVWLGETASDPPSSLAFDLVTEFIRANGSDLREHIRRIGTAQPEYVHSDDLLRACLHAEHQWYEYYTTTSSAHWTQRRQEGRQDTTLQRVLEWFQAAAKDPRRNLSWRALFDLFDRPWWTRCWIVQEVAVCAELQVTCGSNSVAWEDLSLLFTAWYIVCYRIWRIDDTFEDAGLSATITSSNKTLLNINSCRRVPTSYELEGYLRVSRDSLASDARDKVYSMLGMTENLRIYAIKPSYASSNTAADVYVATAKAILQHHKNLNFLINVSGREAEGGMPSWVPNWNQPKASDMITYCYKFESGTSKHANIAISATACILKVHGYVVDILEEMGPADDENGDASQVISAWTSMYARNTKHDNDLHALEKFYNTLGLDRWRWPLGPPEPGNPADFRSSWDEALGSLSANAFRASKQLRFFVSAHGSPGMSPKNALPGDTIFIAWGSRMPFLIRSNHASAGHYQFVGMCYLHGMMYGEVFKREEEGKVKSQDIYLV